MDYFPLLFKLENQNCLVVGAGEVAARKIELLAKGKARITVVAPSVAPVVADLKDKLNLNIILKTFEASDLLGCHLVISATDHNTVNEAVAAAANQQRIPVNVVDNPALCTFIFPAIIDRSPLVIAISSSGAAPVLARQLRAKLESMIPGSYGELAKLAQKFRPKVKQTFSQPNHRRIFWENVFQSRIAELVFAAKPQEAEQQLEHLIQNHQTLNFSGEVYLIGAGPGDPDLLTFKALRLMQQADVIVYDRLVSDEVMELTRRDAEKIYVGKQRNLHTMPQQGINQLLADLAKQGKRVARLKGGDPFIFGRGGEEIETLMQEGVTFQVVPGITAASGCSNYAGIPLTHRDHAQSCVFVTGHLKDGSTNLNWPQLAAPNQTVVFYMGLAGLETICQKMIEHGCPSTHPIAIIQQGTTRNQKVITGILSDLPAQVQQQKIKAPTLIIAGTVVTLHDQLKWFNAEPNDY